MNTAARSTRRATRTAARAAGITAATAGRDEVDVLGLDDEAVLASIAEHRARAERAHVEELRAVAVWADRHRITDVEDWVYRGAVSADGYEMARDLLDRAGHEASELGTEGVLRLGGEGAFAVREFAVTDLAVLLQMSEQGARDYVGQAVELRDRLPRLWGRVTSGQLPVWKARRIAQQTIPLGAAAAGFVDGQLEAFAHKLSLTRITRCVDAAITRFHPDLAATRAQAAEESLGVWLEDDAPTAPPASTASSTRPTPTRSTGHWTSKPRSSARSVTGRRGRRVGHALSGSSLTRSTPST